MTEPGRSLAAVTIKGSAVLDSVRAIKARSGEDGYQEIVDTLDEQARTLFRSPILPTAWFPLDAFARFLEADIRESAGGNEQVLVKRSEGIIEGQLRGIYKLFIRLGSPEFVLKRLSVIHTAYFNGVAVDLTSLAPGRAVIRYTGFEPQHRIMGHTLIGFFRKALEISGAKDVAVRLDTPIGDAKGYAELVVTWH